MAARAYYAAALAYARANGLTAQQVASAGPRAIATAAGLDPDVGAGDFFYRNVRRHVAQILKAEVDADADEAKRLRIRSKLREAAEFLGAEIEKTPEGWLVRLD